jgi:CheY-like chemotaxis protein
MRWLVRAAAGDEFSEIVEAVNGRDLLWTLLRSELKARCLPQQQVVVTDMYMPGYDGLDVLEAWREQHPENPAILITAFPSEAVRARAAKLGVVMLAKPFSTATLRRVLKDVTYGCDD